MALATQTENDLYLLAVNMTRRCNLSCAHCYLDAKTLREGSDDELTTTEVCNLLDQVADNNPEAMVVLTGGEPLIRKDLETMLTHGSRRGLFMVIGTNGMMLTERRVQSLQAAGAMGCGISLDSLDPAKHDAFRGYPGAWQKTMTGMENCRRYDLSFQIHFSVTETNAAEVPAMVDFARYCGALVLNFFFLVCTGRGESMSDISPMAYERVLNQILDAQEHNQDLIIRARCAPHFQRIAHQRDPDSLLTRAQGYDGSSCIAATHYCRITPEGGVTACPYIPDEVGNIRQQSFADIWEQAPGLQRLRQPELKGKCGHCEYTLLCGGCRARAQAVEYDIMQTDPWCHYVPQGGSIIEPFTEHADTLSWSPDAQQRLQRIPAFLRKMVKKRAENYAREQGEQQVTIEHLTVLMEKRFGKNTPAAIKANLKTESTHHG